MSRHKPDIRGEERRRWSPWVTERERVTMMLFLARSRVRDAELSILGIVRKAGVTVWLDKNEKTGEDILRVRDANEEQIAQLRANKELVVAALKAEAKDGPSWDHSALKAGMDALYRAAADNHEFGAARAECEQLLEALDGYLMELDEVGWLGLPDAMARYAKIRPVMEPLMRKINAERAAMLEGNDLRLAAEAVFKDTMRPARAINMAAFE